MLKLLWRYQLIGHAALGAALAVSSAAVAAEGNAALQPEAAQKAAEIELSDATKANLKEVKAAEVVPVAQQDTTTEAKAIEASQPIENAAPKLPVAVALSNEVRPETNATATSSVEQIAQNANNAEILREINLYSNENPAAGQSLQGASKFRDVRPTDWAFQALDDLIKRYDCLVGYPDGTFRGNRPLSRYEFAAGLNACLNQIERLIAEATTDFVTKEDLETLRRLMQEFEAELATLGTRVDNLEARTAFLEDHQFSTTTKLSGEVIFALTNNFGNDRGLNNTLSSIGEAAFGDRVRLTFNTSFTGKDRLVTRLAAGNLRSFTGGSLPFPTGGNPDTTGTYEGTQTFNLQPSENFDNNVKVDWLAYYFPFAGINTLGVNNSYVYVAATGGIWSDIAPTTNPYFEDYDGGNGALSTFASENPIYRVGGGAGAAISFGFSPLESVIGPSTVTLGYLAGEANNPGQSRGLFNGDYAALAQANFNLFDYFAVGLTYVHGYHGYGSPIYGAGSTGTFNDSSQFVSNSGVVGSYMANNPLFQADPGNALGGGGLGIGATVTNSYGAEVAFRPFSGISVSGFVTKTDATLINLGDADIWSWGGGVAFPDFGKQGSVLGFFGGIQPTLRGINSTSPLFSRDTFRMDTGWHVEGFYKYQVTDNISITPGVIWLTRPNQNNNSEPIVIGTLRTTFKF
ncbi:iron uptake porin [Oscillatoria sp. FACHB-1406]|uniref:iron uptake porin n=1 Tax=Oscillatoria sp. FACHB-1406 TaxID=2692846 RepID=UPI001686DE73|nr:iron uptake porin [Oscillatoria sp. FACHB-1406]MBD2580297.1 iron uptake porin [Oscillatoria sp. FACHB-1406]